MNLYEDVKSSWFDPSDADPGDAEAKVLGRCRLRMIIVRGRSTRTGTTSLQLKNGSSSGSVLYQVKTYDENDTIGNQNQVINLGEHGILFSDGIYADYTKSTVFCDSAVLIYS